MRAKTQAKIRVLRHLHTLLALTLLVTLPLSAHAFCGFFVSGADSGLYNDATQVVLMRKGNRTVMSMSNTYKGPAEDFAMVVPVPVVLQKEQVKTLPANVFDKIDKLSAPRLVEYWEQDPCYRPPPRRMYSLSKSPTRATRSRRGPGSRSSHGVKVEAEFTSGEYRVVILSAREANGLERWLVENQYKIPKGASKALRPYIQRGMKFFVAKVDINKVKRDEEGVVQLSPLRFDFESKQLRLPVRLGLLNASGKQDLLVYVLSPDKRYEVANYPNTFIPTNLEVEDEVRQNFGGFYTRLFEEVLKLHKGRVVVTEYAWQTTSCDPCPTPPLTARDLYTLGGDVLTPGSARPDQPRGSRGPRGRGRGRQPVFLSRGQFSNWVLTRLHTRYSRETLSEDLIFRSAKAVVGGRGANGISSEKPGTVKSSSSNQFQGRYIIRHYWEGKVNCKNPIYNRWGGPSGQKSAQGKSQSAGNLSRARASDVKLSAVVRSPLKSLRIKGKRPPKRR